MKVVAVIGPYRADNAWHIEQNIRIAEETAWHVWSYGAAAVCPHSNTRFFHGSLPDDVWLKGYLAILARCDAAVLSPGWQESSGSLAEKAEAERLGIPVFQTLWELHVWLRRQEE